MLKVRFLEKEKQLIVSKDNQKNYFELIDEQALDIFLITTLNQFSYKHENLFQIVDETDNADICIVGIQHTDNTLLRENEFNIFLSVENFSVGRKHYQFWNKFGRNGNSLINAYIYNDIPHPIDNIIPAIYCRINYFNSIYKNFESIRKSIPFNSKKFCLFTSRNGLNNNKHLVLHELSKFGEIDFLDKYDNIIKNKTCYNSAELISLYSQYKFIICFENSKTDGYITEKIFNVFLSGSIPIYDGAPNVLDYINKDSFIQYDENISKKILILNNEKIYNVIINKDKIKNI